MVECTELNYAIIKIETLNIHPPCAALISVFNWLQKDYFFDPNEHQISNFVIIEGLEGRWYC